MAMCLAHVLQLLAPAAVAQRPAVGFPSLICFPVPRKLRVGLHASWHECEVLAVDRPGYPTQLHFTVCPRPSSWCTQSGNIFMNTTDWWVWASQRHLHAP